VATPLSVSSSAPNSKSAVKGNVIAWHIVASGLGVSVIGCCNILFSDLILQQRSLNSLGLFHMVLMALCQSTLCESPQKINVTNSVKHYKDDSKVHTLRNTAILVRLNRDIQSKKSQVSK